MFKDIIVSTTSINAPEQIGSDLYLDGFGSMSDIRRKVRIDAFIG